MDNDKMPMTLYFDKEQIRKIVSKSRGFKIYVPFVMVNGRRFRYLRKRNSLHPGFSKRQAAFDYARTVIFRYNRRFC